MNPTTLNVDPDPEFRPNLDTDPGLPVCRYRYSVLKEKNVLNRFAFRGKNIFLQNIFVNMKIMGFLFSILYQNCFLFLPVLIRIHILNTDPDSQICCIQIQFGSVSTITVKNRE